MIDLTNALTIYTPGYSTLAHERRSSWSHYQVRSNELNFDQFSTSIEALGAALRSATANCADRSEQDGRIAAAAAPIIKAVRDHIS